ncbi:MAG: right-handed parallel beta-helix repeat-containing protein [Candidatus Thermoplasmatota archaeon]|nr:right-handed parallel beta-helix repeat-containing protein [Candidatus Thermoplasmatota archaeon]MBS3802414.1 right-handed parallel beta-helix repeat-containing protein [Candidatus Thermoplasmatota archaeon]
MIGAKFQKICVMLITLLLIGIGFLPSINSQYDNIEVQVLSSGNILYVGGTGPGNYSNIQGAIDDASQGNTVFVYNGIYYENIFINKSIEIKGKDKNKTIIDGGCEKDIINIISNNVVFSDFTIKNAGGFKQDNAIQIHSSNVLISNCMLYRARNGILLKNSMETIIDNCIVHTTGNSIILENSSNIFIENSECCHSGIGITIHQSNLVKIDQVFLHENGVAVFSNFSSNITIINSASCDNNDNGRGISFYNSRDVFVKNCNIMHSGAGFKLVNSSDILFQRCNVENNTHYTFWIHNNSDDIFIQRCNILNNLRHGIHITNSNCSINESNLYGNFIDSIHPTNSNIVAENNYWGSKYGPWFSKGFRFPDVLQKDFGTLTYYPWSTTRFEHNAPDWVVSNKFTKTEVHGYNDSLIILDGNDADMDGVPDWWEKEFGYDCFSKDTHEFLDPDGDALNNIEECYAYAWGADPFRKDIFLELDHMPSQHENTFNTLPKEYILMMMESFAEQNISLHVDQDSCMGGEEIPNMQDFDFSDLVDIYWDYFLHNDLNNPRKNIFHYGLLFDQGPGNGFAFMGWAHLNSFCISVDVLTKNQLFLDRGWLITCGCMHELGHTLGLLPDDFGGNDNHAAIKPKYFDFYYFRNYKSIMNYRYTYSVLDYSDGNNGKVDYNDWDGIEFDFFKNTHFEWPKT